MYRPGPRTINQYDPIIMTKNMIKARANSTYSEPKVAPRTTVRRRMAAKMAKDIAPVMITVLSIDTSIIATYEGPIPSYSRMKSTGCSSLIIST